MPINSVFYAGPMGSMGIMVQMAIAVTYAGVCLLIGCGALFLLLRRSRVNVDPFGMLGSGFLLGQGLLVGVWTLVGLMACFTPGVVWVVLILFLLAGVGGGWKHRHDVRAGLRTWAMRWPRISWMWVLVAMAVIALLSLHGMAAWIKPPSGDAEAFYMVFPKILAASGRITPQPNYYEFSQVGLFGEMHYAALMAIASPSAAKAQAWFTAIAAILMLVAICGQAGLGYRGYIVAVLMLVTSSSFALYISDGKVDLFGAALGLAAFYWALQLRHSTQGLPVVLTGLFAGWACVAKFSNIPVVLPGVFLLMMWICWLRVESGITSIRQGGRTAVRLVVKLGLLVGIGLVISGAPHLAKNAALFHEPFAPFWGSGGRWTDQVWFSPATTNFILATYPIALVYGQYPMQGGNMSALILAMMPMAAWLRPPPRLVRSPLVQVTTIAVICLLLWMAARPAVIAPRYILATLILFIPLAARSAERMFETPSPVFAGRLLVVVGLLVALFIGFYPLRAIPRQFVAFLRGQLPESTFASSYYASLERLNQVARPGARVYLGGYYSYYLRSDLLQCMSGRGDHDVQWIDDPRKRWGDVFDHGFEYVVIQNASHGSLGNLLDNSARPTWLTVSNVYADEASTIYALSSNDPNHIPAVTCRSAGGTAWRVIAQPRNP